MCVSMYVVCIYYIYIIVMSFLLNFLFKTLKSNTLCYKDEFKNNQKAKEKDYHAIN